MQEISKNRQNSRKSRIGPKSITSVQNSVKYPQILPNQNVQKVPKMRPKINQFLSQNGFLEKCLLFIGNQQKPILWEILVNFWAHFWLFLLDNHRHSLNTISDDKPLWAYNHRHSLNSDLMTSHCGPVFAHKS